MNINNLPNFREMYMKNASIIFILIVVLAAGLVFYSRIQKSSVFKKAKQTEASGNLQEALSMYAQALIEIAPGQKFPDINRSKIVEQSAWKKIIEQYISWLSSDMNAKNIIRECFEGIERCINAQNPVNSLGKIEFKELSEDQYIPEWYNSFFAPNITPDPSFKPLASGNYQKNISVINFSSSKNYTYELNLINRKTAKSTGFQLYPESNIRIIAIPGEYLFVCRSTVTFPSGEIWKSPFEIIPLTVPENASLITGDLRTRVYRQK